MSFLQIFQSCLYKKASTLQIQYTVLLIMYSPWKPLFRRSINVITKWKQCTAMCTVHMVALFCQKGLAYPAMFRMILMEPVKILCARIRGPMCVVTLTWKNVNTELHWVHQMHLARLLWMFRRQSCDIQVSELYNCVLFYHCYVSFNSYPDHPPGQPGG